MLAHHASRPHDYSAEWETGGRLRLAQDGRISAMRRPNMMMYSFFPPISVFQRSFYGRLLEKRHYYVEKIMRNVFRGFALYIDGRFQFSPPGQRDNLVKR